MLTTAELIEAQELQLAAMPDRCVIRDPDVWVGEALTEGPVAWTYLGQDEIPCRIAVDDTQSRIVVAGEQDLTVVRLVVTLPIPVCPTSKQVVTVTASTDPALTGRRFDVTSSDVSTYVTARRTHCIEHK